MIRHSLLVCTLLALCCAAFAAVDVQTIYNGQGALPANVTLGEWGTSVSKDAPSISPLPVLVKEKMYGLTVISNGRYQGTRLDFAPPINTESFFGPQDAFLEVYLRAMPGEKKLGTAVPMPALHNLRFTFFTQGGVGVLDIPASQFYPREEVLGTWVKIDLPLQRMPATPIGGLMSRLVISSDEPASFLIGRLAFIRDVSPLKGKITTFPATAEVGKSLFFSANVTSAVTGCAVTWTFDSAAGSSVDATGERVLYTYTNPGAYTVTCTLRDVNGIKEPVTLKKELKVTRARR
ncbi:MAG TPA: PKD domain-containing protein [Armatimonadota bacterium]|jgi:hypothetical protein